MATNKKVKVAEARKRAEALKAQKKQARLAKAKAIASTAPAKKGVKKPASTVGRSKTRK